MVEKESEPLPQWDYEWWGYGEKKSPTNWQVTKNGTASAGMANGYWRVDVPPNEYLQYAWPETFSKGVLQVNFRLNNNYENIRIFLSNGTTAIGVRANYYSSGLQKLLLNDASAIADMTALATIKNKNTYAIRLVLDNGYADVYLKDISAGTDERLVASNVDCSTITAGNPLDITTIRCSSNASSGTSQFYLYGIMMKFNRTE